MTHNTTVSKFAVIFAGLVLTASASVGQAQQKVAEEFLEQTLREQSLAEESENSKRKPETAKESESSDNTGASGLDLSDLYDDEGNFLI